MTNKVNHFLFLSTTGNSGSSANAPPFVPRSRFNTSASSFTPSFLAPSTTTTSTTTGSGGGSLNVSAPEFKLRPSPPPGPYAAPNVPGANPGTLGTSTISMAPPNLSTSSSSNNISISNVGTSSSIKPTANVFVPRNANSAIPFTSASAPTAGTSLQQTSVSSPFVSDSQSFDENIGHDEAMVEGEYEEEDFYDEDGEYYDDPEGGIYDEPGADDDGDVGEVSLMETHSFPF